jgi:lipopolysaccharide biosynthesis regulator YciM
MNLESKEILESLLRFYTGLGRQDKIDEILRQMSELEIPVETTLTLEEVIGTKDSVTEEPVKKTRKKKAE